MGKARKLGAFAPYTPNSKMDMRHKQKFYEKGQESMARCNATPRAERRERKKLERMKREAMNEVS